MAKEIKPFKIELVDGRIIDNPVLQEFVIELHDKGRYEFSPDKELIRAVQGHSIN